MAPVKGPGQALGLKQGLLGGGGTREQADLCVPAQGGGAFGEFRGLFSIRRTTGS